MYNFCTLFDTNYLTRGLAMYRSLQKHCKDFHLYVFAFDSNSFNILTQMKLDKATIISLKEFEDEKLLAVKPTRNIAEYCWTSTSSTVLYVLNNFDVDNCTYLDADLYFYSSPVPLFDELGEKSVLLTEHKYSPQYNKELKSGKYCVQFVTFRKDSNGLQALNWWRERCLEWCYARYEDGKFGDQLYLDDWLTRFEGVHSLEHRGGGLAAWNIQQYNLNKTERSFDIYSKDFGKYEVIFYHFHYLKFFKNGLIELGRRRLSDDVLNLFYKPYVKELLEIEKEVLSINPSIDPMGRQNYNLGIKNIILYFYRKIKGVYNIYQVNDFIKS